MVIITKNYKLPMFGCNTSNFDFTIADNLIIIPALLSF